MAVERRQQKIALVTGASQGIGRETAKLLASQGFDLCIHYLTSESEALALEQQVLSMGQRCFCYRADMAVETEIEAMFSEIDRRLGRITALVNNAALMLPQTTLAGLNAERINRMLNINVTAYFICAREAVKRMAFSEGGAGGAIVNVSSLAAQTGSPNEYLDYAASKGAVDTMTKGLAKEVAKEGIRVNAVRPGLIDTNMHAAGGEPNRIDRVKSAIPLGRGGLPIEVAQAICWLLSEHSSFTTGNKVDVSGGL